MKNEFFSVFDMAAKMYIEPFQAPTIEFAIRGFKEACEQPEHQFAKFPEDYALYHIASFDAELGEMKGFEARKIAQASTYITRRQGAEGILPMREEA